MTKTECKHPRLAGGATLAYDYCPDCCMSVARQPTRPRPVVTCLDCKVLPPFSVALCPVHAAAPEMLAALRECVLALRDGADGQTYHFWNKGGQGYEAYANARALLARVEGKE